MSKKIIFLHQNIIHKIWNAIYSILCYVVSIFSKKSNKNCIPFLFSIEPVNYCNLKCPECPTGNGTMTRSKQKMDLNTFKIIINKIKNNALYITMYFQGEPLLNNDFEEMIKIARNNDIYTATSTNAQLIDEKRAETIVKCGLNKIIIDIDGTTQKIYEKYRIGGSLEKAINGIKYINKWKNILKRNNPKIEMQFLVMKHNESQIKEAKNLAKNLNVNIFTLKTVQLYNYKEGNELMTTINKYSRYNNTPNGYEKKCAKSICKRAFFNSVICVDGTIVPCSNDKNANYSFGNIITQSLSDIYNGEKAKSFRNNILNKKKFDICKNCMR